MTNTIVGITVFSFSEDKIIVRDIYCYADDRKAKKIKKFLWRTKQCWLTIKDSIKKREFKLTGFIFRIYSIDDADWAEIISSKNFYTNLVITNVDENF